MFGRQRFTPIAGIVMSCWLSGTVPAHAAVPPAPVPDLPAATYYLISLERAPLDEAAEAVLIQSLGSTVVVDPDLEAAITFSVAEALKPRELAEQFSVALAEEGIALVRSGDGYRLMDIETALTARPGLDIVSVPPPELRPGAREALSAPVSPVPIAPSDGISRPDGEGFALTALVAAFLVAGSAWMMRDRWQPALMRVRRLRRPFRRDRQGERDAVVDRLLATGTVDLAVLARACETAARRGWPVEQLLCDLGGVSDQALADAYAGVTGLERWSPPARPEPIEDSGADLLGRRLDERAMSLVEADDWAVVVATSDPLDDEAFAEVSRLSGRMVTLVVAARSALTDAPFRDSEAADVPEDRLIIPWGRKRDMEGAALLQAILARRTSDPSGI
jgi:hypothetical protein